MASNVENLIRGAVTKGIVKVADFNRKRLPRPTDAHPFLTGIHKPMTEEFTLEALRVDGEIPRQPQGPPSAQRPQSRRRARSGELSLVHRRGHGPRHPHRRRQGRLVS